jgi:hypothetical protein
MTNYIELSRLEELFYLHETLMKKQVRGGSNRLRLKKLAKHYAKQFNKQKPWYRSKLEIK